MGMSLCERSDAARFHAADSRHIHVEKHQVEAFFANFLQRFLAAARGTYHVPARHQCRAHHAANLRFIIDN